MTDGVADAILYEGYMLYPYRPSALKNQRRWTFGVLEPGARNLVCECLLVASPSVRIHARLRYFRVDGDEPHLTVVSTDLVRPGEPHLGAGLRLHLAPVGGDAFRVRVEVSNPGLHLMASAQVLLHVSDGEWVPPRDPPPALRAANEACQNEGLWPILVGSPGQRQQLLCSPIIVDDYAQVAPESAHAFFDLTEIDELLALRLQTLSAAEQHEIATSPDPTVRDVLHQATNMPAEQLLGLHGARRAPAVGQRVHLRPSARADIMDLALANRAATIVAIENDLEQRTYVAVTIDDDPGKDLGALGQPGHRFFFRPDEVVPVD